MRLFGASVLLGAIFTLTFGCGSKEYSGPRIDKFTGKVLANGKQVTLTPNDEVNVTFTMLGRTGVQYTVDVKPDGTWQIGWMPVGNYSAVVEKRNRKATKGPGVNKMALKDEFKVEPGKTDYTIDLGKAWK